MGLETGDYISDLTITNPLSADPKSAGDDHLRLLKKVARQSFPGFTGPILVGGTTAGSVNAYTLTPSTAVVAYVANTILVIKVHIANTSASTINVSALGTRNIKTVSGAALTSADMPIDCYVAMVDTGAEYRIIGVTKNYVDLLAFNTALPAQAGNNGKYVTTDGTNASWAAVTTPTAANPSASFTGAVINGSASTFMRSDAAPALGNLAVAVNTARATVASAATTADIWAAAGNQIDWTGTTTCTAFPAAPQAGAERVLITAGAAVFTAGANMLIDGVASGNLTCDANDQVIVRAVTTTQFKLSRVKYDGTAQVSVGGITTTASITTSTSLTSASAGYQYIAMTALGKSVTLPDATTASIGSPKFYLDNTSGGYPVGIRNYSGTLLMGIAAGGTAFVSCQNISSAAGVWAITGTNLEPGLITIDSTFSSTYLTTRFLPFVALDSNKSIHFLALSSGFAAVAVDNTTGAVGTPVTVSATASMVPRTAFMITSTTAIVFYSSTVDTLISVVISLSGATTLTVGTASSTLTATGAGVEDFSGAPKIAQLAATLYLVSYATATGVGSTTVAAFQVSGGTTVNLGSAVNIIAANNVIDSTTTYGLTATTGLVIYMSAASAPYTISAVVVSVTNANPPVCTVGTPAAGGTRSGSISDGVSSCLLSATKVLIAPDTGDTIAGAQAVTITGTSVSVGAVLTVETVALNGALGYIGSSATRYNPHLSPLSASTALLWYFNSGAVSRAVVLSESAGTVTKGTILYRSISTATSNAAGGGAIFPQGTSEFVAANIPLSIANGGAWRLVPHKINGTVITSGNSAALVDVPTTDVIQLYATRLSSGNYLTGFEGGSNGCTSITVFSSNGDCIRARGSIACPALGGTVYPIPSVASNRIALLGSAQRGTTVSSSTLQARLLNIEVAA